MSVVMTDLMQSIPYAWPELVLAGYALIATLIGAWSGDRSFGFLSLLGTAAIVVAGALAIVHRPAAPVHIFQGELSIDGLAVFAKALVAFSAAATLILGADHFNQT